MIAYFSDKQFNLYVMAIWKAILKNRKISDSWYATMDDILNLDSNMKLLASSILKLTETEDYCSTSIPGLTVFKKTEATTIAGAYEPSVCLVAQGAKRVHLGDETYIYDTKHYLFSGVHLPVVAKVNDASIEQSYLGLKLTFDYQ